MCVIHTPGSNWRPFEKKICSNVSGNRLKILEHSGKNQGIPSGKKCRYPDGFYLHLTGILFTEHGLSMCNM